MWRLSEVNPLEELLVDNNKLREWLYEECIVSYNQNVLGLDIPTTSDGLVDQNGLLMTLISESYNKGVVGE